MIVNIFIVGSFLGFLLIGSAQASHDMDVAGQSLAANAFRGQFVLTDQLSLYLKIEQINAPWKGKWNNPGHLSSEELSELEERILAKINDPQKFTEFLDALKASGLNRENQETILLLLPDLLDIVL